MLLVPLGGAVARVDSAATAFAHRQAAYNLEIAGAWPPDEQDAEPFRQWAERCWHGLRPWATGVEVNHVADEGPDRVRAAYGQDTWARLTALKSEWDPDNLFRLNQNVPPTTDPARVPGTTWGARREPWGADGVVTGEEHHQTEVTSWS